MFRILLFIFIILIIGGCSTAPDQQHYERNPSAVYSPDLSCGKIAVLFFKDASITDIKKVAANEIEILNKTEGNFIFEDNIEYIYDIDGSTIDLTELSELGQTIKDKKRRIWTVESWYLDGSPGSQKRDHVVLSRGKKSITLQLKYLEMKGINYEIAFKSGQRIEVLIPDFGEESSERLLAAIQEKLILLPEKFIDAITKFRIMPQHDKSNPAAALKYKIKNFISGASARGSELSFYTQKDENLLEEIGRSLNIGTIRHELGHSIATKIYKQATPPAPWTLAMEKDTHIVSSYARTTAAEDFAETVRYYLEIEEKGLNHADWSKFSHRFALLDEIFLANKDLRYQVKEMIATREKIKKIGLSITTGTGAVLILTSPDEEKSD